MRSSIFQSNTVAVYRKWRQWRDDCVDGSGWKHHRNCIEAVRVMIQRDTGDETNGSRLSSCRLASGDAAIIKRRDHLSAAGQ